MHSCDPESKNTVFLSTPFDVLSIRDVPPLNPCPLKTGKRYSPLHTAVALHMEMLYNPNAQENYGGKYVLEAQSAMYVPLIPVVENPAEPRD
jgi:hypothetical protein